MKTLIAVFFVLVVSGCSTQRIKIDSDSDTPTTSHHVETWNLFYDAKDIDASGICGKRKVNRVEVRDNFFEAVLGTITLGLVRDHVADVYCE